MKYVIQAQLNIEIDAESPEKAKETIAVQFEKIEKLGVEILDAKVIDKASGYFVK